MLNDSPKDQIQFSTKTNNQLITPLKQLEPHQLPVINFSAKRIIRFLCFVVLGLSLANLAGLISEFFLGYANLKGLVPLFDVDKEGNIPSTYSSFALLFCCILLAIIAIIKHKQGDRYAFQWKCLSLIFLYLSVDEAASIHELAIDPLRQALNLGGIFYFAWVIPGAILVGIFVLAYLKFLMSLPAKTRNLFIIAGLTFVGGALGIELVGGAYADAYEQTKLAYSIITTIEEGLEMLGILVFIYALLDYIETFIKSVLIQMDKR